MNTREKIEAAAAALFEMPREAMAPEARSLVEHVQMLRGLADFVGMDLPENLVELVVPADDAEADVLVDKLIGLLLELRGDDLPPFDLARYGEATAGDDPDPLLPLPDAA